MRFIPKSQQEQLPKVVVTTEYGHTSSKTIYPESTNQNYTDRDNPSEEDWISE